MADLRKKLLYTGMILLLFRIGAAIPVPFLEPETLKTYITEGGNWLGYIDLLSGGAYGYDPLTDFLETIQQKTRFHYWLFGHYHYNRIFEEKYVLLWEQMVRVL